MIDQAVEFYSSLIGRESRDNIRMAEDFLKESESFNKGE
jgi:hypothetical protein